MKNHSKNLESFHRNRTPPHLHIRWKSIACKSILITGFIALLFILCISPATAHALPDEHTDWIAWSDPTTPPAATGNYYLENNIELDSPWQIPEGAEITLCLNGWLINQNEEHAHVIEIPSGATLNLYDCSNAEHYFNEDGEGLWILADDETGERDHHCITGGAITESLSDKASGVWINGGTFNMYGGNIIGNYAVASDSDNGYGGGVHMSSGAFNMHGGKIAGNLANSGGGVDMDAGVFKMYGGEISYNNVTANGGGVDIEGGIFYMYGGSIAHNSAGEYAGGVRLSSGNEFVMEGGSISYNTAQYDAGVSMFSDETHHDYLTMRGGEISHNTATLYGGGVGVGAWTVFTMEGGCVTENTAPDGAGVILYVKSAMLSKNTGTLVVSGDAKIKGNLYDGNENNVFTYVGHGDIIIGDDGLSGDASIGIMMSAPLTEEMSPFTIISDTGGANAKYFSSDRTDEYIIYDEATRSILITLTAPTTPTPDYNDVKIIYDVKQRYVVSIPSDMEFNPSVKEFDNEVNVTEFYLMQGNELHISFESKNVFNMVIGDPAISSIKYTMSKKDGDVFEGPGLHEIMIVPAGISKEGEDYWIKQKLYYTVTDDDIAKAKFAGEHKDTLTFKVEVQESA